ncbi:MAG: aminoglycoside phosphotransferase family protein [Maribacter sp.]|nr:aminoglycoside phosphotransferase family protein [Maribacter sp.]
MGTKNLITASAILQHFSVAPKTYTLQAINNGFINDTFLVLDEALPRYILQRINKIVFGDIEGLMANLNQALKALADPEYAQITLIKTPFGATYFENRDGYWRLMTYLGDSTTYNTTTNPLIAYEAGRIIGKFHLLLKDADIQDYTDTIPHFHDLGFRMEQFKTANTKASLAKKTQAEKPIKFVPEIFRKLSILNRTDLPLRICHNDTKLNNILFSKKEHTALCLIDLDTLMKGYFYYDFGDALRTIANSAPEDEKNLDKITFDRSLFESFLDGLASIGPLLNQQELSTLSYGVVFMPFLHGLRALTDYLNDNIYYKVTYENQNLDRCLSLFNFTQKALDELDYMGKTIKEKIPSIP